MHLTARVFHHCKLTVYFWRGIKYERLFYQTTKDEEDHEKTTQCGLCINVSIAHSGHGDHEQVHTLPVGEFLGVLKVFPWVSGVFHLEHRSGCLQQVIERTNVMVGMETEAEA